VKFEQKYSSSSGNLYTLQTSTGKTLLIEAGVPYKKLLKALNYDLSSIEGCLLSHEHLDHSKAVIDVISAGIDIYTSAGTLSALGITEDCPHYRRAKAIANNTLIKLPSFQVFAFDTNHDAKQPLGFVIREISTGEFMLFATDTSYIEQRFAYPFSIIALECSYSKDILEQRVAAKTIDEELAKRLLTSHLEKGRTMQYISDFCDLSKCRQVHLLHLSAENIDKQQTINDFESKFFLKPITI